MVLLPASAVCPFAVTEAGGLWSPPASVAGAEGDVAGVSSSPGCANVAVVADLARALVSSPIAVVALVAVAVAGGVLTGAATGITTATGCATLTVALTVAAALLSVSPVAASPLSSLLLLVDDALPGVVGAAGWTPPGSVAGSTVPGTAGLAGELELVALVAVREAVVPAEEGLGG
jgi:hypothetical protein